MNSYGEQRIRDQTASTRRRHGRRLPPAHADHIAQRGHQPRGSHGVRAREKRRALRSCRGQDALGKDPSRDRQRGLGPRGGRNDRS